MYLRQNSITRGKPEVTKQQPFLPSSEHARRAIEDSASTGKRMIERARVRPPFNFRSYRQASKFGEMYQPRCARLVNYYSCPSRKFMTILYIRSLKEPLLNNTI